jgi:hypothetical protein
MNELKTFLELWEIPITRRQLECRLDELQLIFKDEIAAYRKGQTGGKINVQVFINAEAPGVASEIIQ